MRTAVLAFLGVVIYRTDALFGDRILKQRTPATGPCTLNDDGLKCNENGYYETVQCDRETCYCVTPHTALVSYDTKTNNPKTAPKCGACLVYLQKLFANGDPPENSFVPKCDVGKGNFEPVQCENKKNECFCVDITTGREIPGSRKPLGDTGSLHCMKMNFSIDSTEFPTFEKSETPRAKKFEHPLKEEFCKMDRNPGHKCNENKTSIRYWFDQESFSCLPFEHKGCGGNGNSFADKPSCYVSCVYVDYFSCPMQSLPAKRSSGKWYSCGNQLPLPPPGFPTTTTPGPTLNESGCPQGYTCQMGAFFGYCCEESLTKRYQASFRPECKNKKKPFEREIDGFGTTIIGKACSDNFCPATHTCEKNEFFAFCCPK